jgi:hypothetical protein
MWNDGEDKLKNPRVSHSNFSIITPIWATLLID